MFAIPAIEPGSLLRHPPFVRFWCGRMCSVLGYQVQAVAIGWQIYALTDSPFALGLVGLTQFLPIISLVLLVGHVADRYDRRGVVAWCQRVEALCSLAFCLGAWYGWSRVEPLYAIILINGIARAFEAPTMAALTPSLVSEAQLQQALAWSASSNQTATIVGPALGGFLYVAGAPVAFAFATLSIATASILFASIHYERVAPRREPASWASVFSGIVYIWNNPPVLGAISLDLFAVLLGGATALLPIFARDILHTGPWGLGILRAAPAVGALLTSAVIIRYPLQRAAGRVMFAAVLVYGAATIVFGLSGSLALSLGALAVLGCADVTSVVIRNSLVTQRTPDAMRGRVSAVNYLFVGTSNQLGEFESGTAAALFGTVPAVLIGGIGTIGVALLWMQLFPSLRRVETLE